MMRNSQKGLVALLFGAIPFFGCSYTPKPMPNIRVEQCSMSHFGEDYKVGAELFDTKEENRKVFDSKITGDFLPIYFVVENNGREFLAAYGTQNVGFIDGFGENWQEAGAAKLSGETDKNPSLASLLINKIASTITSSSIKVYNRDKINDYISKVLPAQAEVCPGGERRGFVIFRMPEDLDNGEFYDRLKGSKVRFKVYKNGRGVDNIEMQAGF